MSGSRIGQLRFEYMPIWGIVVFLVHRIRRINCVRCGLTVEMVPWWALYHNLGHLPEPKRTHGFC